MKERGKVRENTQTPLLTGERRRGDGAHETKEFHSLDKAVIVGKPFTVCNPTVHL